MAGDKPRGRPTKYTPEIAQVICERLASGESLRAICDDDDEMPGASTVRLWAIRDEQGFSAQYAEARQVQAMGWAEEIVEISNDASEDVMRSRLKVDARKWVASKIVPKVYGDKLPTDAKGNDVPVVNFSRSGEGK